MGYRKVNWKPGEIAKVVNEVRKNYVNNSLPPISEGEIAKVVNEVHSDYVND